MSIQKFLAIGFLIAIIACFCSETYCEQEAAFYYRKAQIQYKHQMYNYAILSLELALGSDPRHVEAANLLAKIYLENYNDKVKALQYFLQSLQANDAQPDIHLEVGKLYYFFNEYQKAKQHLTKAIQQKQLVYAHYYLACIYNIDKDYAAASIHSDQCNRLTDDTVRIEMEKGSNAKMKGNLDEAIAHYLKAIEINPASSKAYMELALLYRMKKKLDKAIDILENCIKVYPNDTNTLLTLAHVCAEYKHPKRRAFYINRAIALCKIVIANDSSRCEAYSLLFEIYKQLNDAILRDENADYYNKCLESTSN
ncbi:MAG: tetratricopeptide repeat protein [Spirochaetes bacterium]|nr:tetratricopeptide repeat protein [Spirochaetota bacterium]